MRYLLKNFAQEIETTQNQEHLFAIMSDVSRRLGFDHFALTYDERFGKQSDITFLIHDYPEPWARVYEDFGLFKTDPVRRTCAHSFVGFPWKDIARHISVTRGDRQMLAVGRDNGISDGFTVPRHLPGIASGACSFVVGPGKALPVDVLYVAELIGGQALATAKRLCGRSGERLKVKLSDRQRECVLWSARGLTAAQIAKQLGISENTVVQHLRTARERYDVNCSEALILCTLFDGLICFADVYRWWNLH